MNRLGDDNTQCVIIYLYFINSATHEIFTVMTLIKSQECYAMKGHVGTN